MCANEIDRDLLPLDLYQTGCDVLASPLLTPSSVVATFWSSLRVLVLLLFVLYLHSKDKMNKLNMFTCQGCLPDLWEGGRTKQDIKLDLLEQEERN